MAENLTSAMQDHAVNVKLGIWEQKVTMVGGGSLLIETQIKINESLHDLPRIGIEMAISSTMEETCFFANGPNENYVDRCISAHAGVYEESVSECPETYVVPQEQGSRTGLRWIFFSSLSESQTGHSTSKQVRATSMVGIDEVLEGKQGLLMMPIKDMLQFNTSRCTDAQLFAGRHVNDLEPSENTIYVRFDAAHRGLGTGSCGPQTLPRYQVDGGTYHISFWIKPLGFDG